MKQNYLKYILAFCIVCSCTVCVAIDSSYEDDINALKDVKSIDGINEEEAFTISKAFFWTNISGCGFPGKPKLVGGYWVSNTRVGYAGTPGESIYVDKYSGSVRYGTQGKLLSLDELKEFKYNKAN